MPYHTVIFVTTSVFAYSNRVQDCFVKLLAGRKLFYARPIKTIALHFVALLAQIYDMQTGKFDWRDNEGNLNLASLLIMS